MRLESYVAVLLVLRDDAPVLDETAAAALQDAHLGHLADLHEAGDLRAAGPLLDPRYRGLCLYDVDAERARELAEQDPAVRIGRFDVVVLPWLVPAGVVAFPPGRLPRSVAEVDDA